MNDVSLRTQNIKEHLTSVASALATSFEAGARLRLSNCPFRVRSAEILGRRVDEDGLWPSDAHVDAIKEIDK